MTPAMDPPDGSDGTDEVLRAEAEWTRAHLELDLETIDRLMASEYIQISSDGEVRDRAQVLASLGTGSRSWDAASSEQLRVRVLGQVAVVDVRWRARGVNAGRAFDYESRYVSVWLRRDHRWQMVSDQSTEVRSPGVHPS